MYRVTAPCYVFAAKVGTQEVSIRVRVRRLNIIRPLNRYQALTEQLLMWLQILISRVVLLLGFACLPLQRPTGTESGTNQGQGGQLLPRQDQRLPGEAAESPPGRQNRPRAPQGVRNLPTPVCWSAREVKQVKNVYCSSWLVTSLVSCP